MQIELTPNEVSALMNRLPDEARSPTSGFLYDEPSLTVPEEWSEAATAVMAENGWREISVVIAPSPAEKLAAFLAANPDVMAMVGV